MYTDIYLSFADEATARAVLYRTEGAVEANPELGIEASPGYEVANYRNIDAIGVIYKNTGTAEEPVMEPIPGWHVNVRLVDGENKEVLKAYQVNPSTPVRVWG